MNEAKENYITGKVQLVTAEEAKKKNPRTVSSMEKRFFCKNCGEDVTFVHSNIVKSYFQHRKRNEEANYCELRSQKQNLTIYERVGLPLYLVKNGNYGFELHLGFYALQQEWLDNAKNQQARVEVYSLNGDKTLFCIDSNNFSISDISFKRIEFISTRYRVEYSSDEIRKMISPKWGDSCEGLLSTGTLFTYSETGGRKIRINDEITTDTNYYCLCRKDNNFNGDNCIEVEECGEIFFTKTYFKYAIYKIKFMHKNEEDFGRLNKYCREFFKVSLIYKPSSLVPMWPPIVKKDNQASFLYKQSEIIFILHSEDNEDCQAKVFTHKNTIMNDANEIRGKQFDDNMHLIKITTINGDVVININERDSSIVMMLNYYDKTIKVFENSICIQDHKGFSIDKGVQDFLPGSGNIQIFSTAKCDIIRKKKGNIIRLYKISSEEGCSIEDIDFTDELYYAVNRSPFLQWIKKIISNKDYFDDEQTYRIIYNLKDQWMVPPIWIKKLLLLLNHDTKTYKIVRKFFVSNNIPVHVVKILKELYKEMKAVN